MGCSLTHVFAKIVDEVARREEVDCGEVLSPSRIVVVACPRRRRGK
jgi:hypothetical protein